jgi:hypothetical protein
MDIRKKNKLKKMGGRVTSVREFLGLSQAGSNRTVVDLKTYTRRISICRYNRCAKTENQ